MALSKRERDRLVVFRQVKEGKLKQKAAAQQLGLSQRWVKKLIKRVREEGDRGLAHRLRGRPSNRAHQAKTQPGRERDVVGGIDDLERELADRLAGLDNEGLVGVRSIDRDSGG